MSVQHPSDEEYELPPAPVQQHLLFDLLVGETERVPLPGRLFYTPQAPFTAHLDFPSPSARIRPWLFSRDLLQEGMISPAGEGDVRIWPVWRGPDRPAAIRIRLSGRTSSALLEAPIRPVREWLVRAYQSVPPGTEGALFDWDEALAHLLHRR